MQKYRIHVAALVMAVLAIPTLSSAQPGPAAAPRPQTDMEKKGIDYLLKMQEKDGSWVPQVGPAITAMNVKALVQDGKPIDDPAIKKALDYIETCHQKDGGYYKDSNPNYNSCVVLSMFAALQQASQPQLVSGQATKIYVKEILELQTFLKGLQQDDPKKEGKGGGTITKASSWYGGAGYGEDRPDLSNTSYFMEALHDSGITGSDPAMQKALIFVTRSQMLGETNDQDYAKGATDGGFIYTPVAGGESKFGDIDKLDGGSQLRSYGTMTYSGFKSLLYAGLTEDDPRVKAAAKWISSNWTLEINPGSSSFDGQFYYFHAFSKALAAWKHDQIVDAKGVKHDWRQELADALKKSQGSDGSWTNTKSERWFEGNPVLATSYSVLALQEARK